MFLKIEMSERSKNVRQKSGNNFLRSFSLSVCGDVKRSQQQQHIDLTNAL
jgi:hypothetical protein